MVDEDVHSVGVLVKLISTGHILMVSQKRSPEHWCLPGGKRFSRETPRAAAIRELFEETDVIALSTELTEIYRAPSGSGSGKLHVTYSIPGWQRFPMQKEPDVRVKWGKYEELLKGPYAPYYEGMKSTLFST